MAELIDALRNRSSNRAISDRPVDPAIVRTLVEAVRWAPSSSNRQPWRLLFAESAEARAAWDAGLAEGNRGWAPRAALKIVVLGNPEEQPEIHGQQRFLLDCGLALGALLVQARASGLHVRAMAGFDEQAIRTGLNIPEPFRVVALVAAGHPARAEDLPPDVQEKETRPRTRKPPEEIAFRDRIGEPLVKGSA